MVDCVICAERTGLGDILNGVSKTISRREIRREGIPIKDVKLLDDKGNGVIHRKCYENILYENFS